ncbi:hypothetical protein JTE90_003804 [Oedothorax gibbosus]|uniref:MADF domain-containing protein n=1 Tax=Oedothorax gibbosus TaxID=931172 RepID=A0AAV6VBB4_9ARAC|nr:hypothetical protein JTE90_003804 [Oedothorax gibbosus]
MASMTMYFNADDEETLIDMVKGYPALYDMQRSSYKNFSVKAMAWKEISEKLNKSEEACKAKWKHIRDWYIRKKKAGKLPVGSGTCHPHLHSRYEKLRFLGKPDISAESSQGVTKDIKEEHSESEHNSDESQSMLEDNDEHALIQYKKTPSILKLKVPKKKTRTLRGKFFSLHPKTKRKRSEDKQEDFKRKRTLDRDDKECISVSGPKNPIDEFFGAMASIVKQLPANVQVQVKQEVSQIILMAESRVVSSQDTLSQLSNASSCSLNGCQEVETVYSSGK